MCAPVARIAHLQPRTRRHGSITDHFRANSRDVAAPGPVVRPTDQSQAPEIETESDQIDLQRAAAPARTLLSPTSRESAQTGSLARLRRRHVWLGPRNEQRETSFRGQSGPTWHHGLLTTHFQSQPTCRRAGRTRLTRPTDPAGAPDIENVGDQIASR